MSQTSAFPRRFQVDVLSEALTDGPHCSACVAEARHRQSRREDGRGGVFSPLHARDPQRALAKEPLFGINSNVRSNIELLSTGL